jgi:hypothetical protein
MRVPEPRTGMAASIREDEDVDGVEYRPRSYRIGSFSFADEAEDPYFMTQPAPEGLDVIKRRADEFIHIQKTKGRSVVLVTSGGSTVPLEVSLALVGTDARIKPSDLLTTLALGHAARVLVCSFLLVLTC